MTSLLGRIVYFVKDAPALAEWYRDHFGLVIKYDGLDEGWIELDSGSGCTLAFHTVDKPEPSTAEIAFVVNDVEATRQRLISKGIDMHNQVLSWRHYQYCKGRDPEGNIFQIINET